MGRLIESLSGGGNGRGRSRVRRGLAGCSRVAPASLLVAAVLVVVPGSAGAASWSIQPTPNSLSGPNTANGLFGVSCTSDDTCTAAGWVKDLTTDTTATLAERWNGTSWTIQLTQNPAGSANPQPSLADVSCTSEDACTAVGDYYTPSQRATLAERWDGSSWTIQPTPNPAGKNSYLLGVSCMSSSACVAVGYYDDLSFIEPQPFAERWNGTTWTIESVPPPPEASDSQLTRVSCTSANACTAVGAYDRVEELGPTPGTGVNAVFVFPLVERWNGATWSVQRTSSPASPSSAGGGASVNCNPFQFVSPCVDAGSATGFEGVSCALARACTAVGDYENSAGNVLTLGERWDGLLWLTQSTPNPDPSENYLDGVSCTSSSACTAVGLSGANFSTPFGEGWDGNRWSIETVPTPAGTNKNALFGPSCSSATACTATGYSYNPTTQSYSTLVERYS